LSEEPGGAAAPRRTPSDPLDARAADAGRDWYRGGQAAVCDELVPWEHGTIALSSRHRHYWSYNLLRVESGTGLTAAELAEQAECCLSAFAHRRVDVEEAAIDEQMRPDFEALGWEATPIVLMRHAGSAPTAPLAGEQLSVEEVPYDDVRTLRERWHLEDYPEPESDGFYGEAREVAMMRDVRIMAVREQGMPISFAQLERRGAGAEITQVYVAPEHRGAGLGTAMTSAAIVHAGIGAAGEQLEDLWIAADAEDRPKELYARLGFATAWRMIEFTRLPY
jgi:GNAT superfamily N-acetyltransferase